MAEKRPPLRQKAKAKNSVTLTEWFRLRRAEKKAQLEAMTPRERRRLRNRKRRIRKMVIWRSILSVLTVIVLLAGVLLGAGWVVFKGPSQSFADLVTVSMLETSALKFVPRIYYSEDTVNQIVERNQVIVPEEETDTSLITISTDSSDTSSDDEAESAEPEQDIEIEEIHGGTYHGYMMIVHDPSRVSVGVCRENFNSDGGMQLNKLAEKYNAVAAINGGGFVDDTGTGNGGQPRGVVIKDGKILNRSGGNTYKTVIGFDNDNKLIIGVMSAKQALAAGIRDAVTFGPALVVNGEACQVSGVSSGLNPRAAIGQRADGAVLMLVIEGRHVNSMGATLSDLIEIMMEYGAVNAANLDGGSSAMLYYNGEYVNEGVVLTGSRRIPTCFIVN